MIKNDATGDGDVLQMMYLVWNKNCLENEIYLFAAQTLFFAHLSNSLVSFNYSF